MVIKPLYKATVGLNDKLDPMRGSYAEESGTVGLVKADNITIDTSGGISRREGYTNLLSSLTHSLFSCYDYGLCVNNNHLCLINGDFTLKILTNVDGTLKMAYARSFDATDDCIYFTNGKISGTVLNKSYQAWTVKPYVGVKSTEALTRTFASKVPTGQILEIYNGRMYIADGNIVYFSEPYAYSWFNMTSDYMIFNDQVTMVRGLTDCMYISTTEEIFFLEGASPKEFKQVRAFDAGVIEGTDIKIIASQYDIQAHDNALIFCTNGKGICTCDNGGQITNHTKTTLNFPEARIGCAYIDTNNHYVVTLIQ